MIEPNKSVPTYSILNKLNIPWILPFSSGLPWMTGKTLSNCFRNSMILVIFSMFLFCQDSSIRLISSRYRYQLFWWSIPTAVILYKDLSIWVRMVLADLHEMACSWEFPPNKIKTFFIYSPLKYRVVII